MKLHPLNIDEIANNLKEVSNPKILENGRFSKKGLFSQQIFGPIKSYQCMCGKKKGRKHNGEICKDCGVRVTTTAFRRTTYGKIVLPFPILNPLFFFLMNEIKPMSQSILSNLLEYKKSYYFDENEELIAISNLEEFTKDVPVLVGLKGAIQYIEHIVNKVKEGDAGSKFLLENFNQVTINNVLVLPPSYRPCNRGSGGIFISDEINRIYLNIITRSNHVKQMPVECGEDDNIYRSNFKQIQKLVFELYKYIFDKLSKKKGLIRSNILGKRVDFSARAVISPDPNLLLNECSVPYFILLEIYKPQLTTYLVNKRVGKRYNAVVKIIDECIENNDMSLYPYVEDFCKDKICILNRQPTLHRLSILGFRIKPNKGNTIQIHPLICPPFNADFDGDSCISDIIIKNKDKLIHKHISELENMEEFKFFKSKTREDGVIVDKYKPNKEFSILAIDPETGKIKYKNISEYTVHKNIELYKIHDQAHRFKDFHSSYDHSLIVYDENDQTIKKISPKELSKNPEGKYFLKQERINDREVKV